MILDILIFISLFFIVVFYVLLNAVDIFGRRDAFYLLKYLAEIEFTSEVEHVRYFVDFIVFRAHEPFGLLDLAYINVFVETGVIILAEQLA